MKGITKNIQLEVVFGGIQKDPWGNEKAGFEVFGKINRSEWGLVWNTILETRGVMLGEEVTISADIELLNLGAKEMTMELIERPGKSIF
jgi:polyisoprenoid-binding protein YceI